MPDERLAQWSVDVDFDRPAVTFTVIPGATKISQVESSGSSNLELHYPPKLYGFERGKRINSN